MKQKEEIRLFGLIRLVTILYHKVPYLKVCFRTLIRVLSRAATNRWLSSFNSPRVGPYLTLMSIYLQAAPRGTT